MGKVARFVKALQQNPRVQTPLGSRQGLAAKHVVTRYPVTLWIKFSIAKCPDRAFQERRAIVRIRGHKRAKAFGSVINRTRKYSF